MMIHVQSPDNETINLNQSLKTCNQSYQKLIDIEFVHVQTVSGIYPTVMEIIKNQSSDN